MKNTKHAERVYEITSNFAGANAIAQGLSGVIGCGANLLVDIAAIPFYSKLYGDITNEYGQGSMSMESAFAFIRMNLPYILEDIVFDKLAATIPLVGIPINVAYAKALTWRLGAWFGVLAALGDDVSQKEMVRSILKLVREFFPIEDMLDVWSVFTFQFKAPDKERFVAFLTSLEGLTAEEVEERVNSALDALNGYEAEQEETEEGDESEEDEGDEEAGVIWLPVPLPFSGGGAAALDTEEISFEMVEYQSGLFPALYDNIAPDQEWNQGKAAQVLLLPATTRFNHSNQSNNSHTAKASMQEGKNPKLSSATVKRKHVATGKPKGRPSTSRKSVNR